jgi:hypothetical protein
VKGSDRSRGGARPVTADKKIHPIDISLPIAGFAVDLGENTHPTPKGATSDG